MATPSVLIVGADKGGVGKTFVTRALRDYLAARHISRRLFDTESPMGILKRFAPEAEVIDIASIEDQMRVFDQASAAAVTVLDLRAGSLSLTLQALEDAQLLIDVRAGRLKLVVLHVLGPTMASVQEIAAAAARLGGGAMHFLVKNHVNASKFPEWDEGNAKETFARYADITINVPTLKPVAVQDIERVGSGFGDFTIDAAHSRVLRGYVATWLKSVWAEFDRVGLGAMLQPEVPQPAAAVANPT